MVLLDYANRENIAELHYSKLEEVIKLKPDGEQDELYANIRKLIPELAANRDAKDYSWLKQFILADADTLERWVNTQPDNLKFKNFKDIYLNQFAKDPDIYLDAQGTYNAYALLKMMGVKVCPYCDEAYLEIFNSRRKDDKNGNPTYKDKRTFDIDHFYAKGAEEYPALAMCFYNLIPSCKGCNQTMLTVSIEANPYHEDIESWSQFEPDVPIARILESLDDDEVKIKLKTNGKMTCNKEVLGLEERYNSHTEIIRQLLISKRGNNEYNRDEKSRLGISDEVIQQLYGPSYPALRGKVAHQKLRNDILGV